MISNIREKRVLRRLKAKGYQVYHNEVETEEFLEAFSEVPGLRQNLVKLLALFSKSDSPSSSSVDNLKISKKEILSSKF